MVLIRRRDRRNKNDTEEDVVIESGIKGKSKLKTTKKEVFNVCRFAADSRVCRGGYGRPNTTWGVEHPWHVTQEQTFRDLSMRDGMENGDLLYGDSIETSQKRVGESRAVQRRNKRKLKQKDGQPEPFPSHLDKSLTILQEKPSKKEQLQKGKKKEQLQKGKKKEQLQKGKKKEQLQKGKKKEQLQEKKSSSSLSSSTEQDLNNQKLGPEEWERLSKQYEDQQGEKVKTESGLEFIDSVLGKGRIPQAGELVTVKYRGSLGQGGRGIGKGMMSFVVGSGKVIAAWDEAISTMRSGGKRILFVPSHLAYGNAKSGEIPENSDLYFNVELVRIGKRKRDQDDDQDTMIPLPKSFVRKKIKSKHHPNN